MNKTLHQEMELRTVGWKRPMFLGDTHTGPLFSDFRPFHVHIQTHTHTTPRTHTRRHTRDIQTHVK